jgi:hypothetical protein
VYQNRRRVRGGYGKSLLRRRGELKRQLVHVGAFNLSLILRQVLDAGTPRQWEDPGGHLFRCFIYYLLVGKIEIGAPEAESQYLVRNRLSNHKARLATRCGWSC